ncbi:hypothetical protein Rhe02_28380 [Rhizocola hellebori]|uniref:Uncharacterized protein n=1 Tax=Rhizocola hellebori TaxID=1392758 RepID=A0A8J3Q6K7_9ACTN|nr:hypothetical protein [Rhizocola hellebori]GIH04771.1 hypothetical protein Rhe02_28380 [Rhizocola hellebori]
MIVASLVLILGAVVLLVLGLINGSSGLLVGSIGTSLLAAVALVVGVRQAGASRSGLDLESDDEDEQFDDAEVDQWTSRSGQRSSSVYEDEPELRSMVPPARSERVWAESSSERSGVDTLQATQSVGVSVPMQSMHEELDDEDPPDEPVAQRVTASDAARVARMSADVLVIDGRPRYHVAGCVHLLGRPFEPLPVSEAVELGFSPCGLCEPDSALLADARRV